MIYFIPAIEKLSFHLYPVIILGSMEYGRTRNDLLRRKINETNGIEIQSQHWGGNRQLSMEDIPVEYFPTSIDTNNNDKNMNSDDNEQDSCD